MKYSVLIILTAALLLGCSTNDRADAYGTFSTSEIYPASEITGKIATFYKGEGDDVIKDELIALIDTTDIQLQILEMQETINLKNMAVGSREAEIAVLNQQKANLEIDKNRFEMLTAAAATAEKNLDDVMAALRVLNLRIEQANQALAISRQEVVLAEVKMSQLLSKKKKHFLRAPIKGTILQKYNAAGEMSVAGKPFCKLADLSVMTAKVYISETQLPRLKLNQEVFLAIDTRDGGTFYITGAKVTHIAEEAEFTPKIIQTKEERVKLVYEVEVSCPNDGEIKVGMPVEMYLERDF